MHVSIYISIINAVDIYQKVNEYDQEMPQSQTTDHPTAPRERATGHLQ